MTKILLGLVCSLALSACGPEHKSVTEPLTMEEADELNEKYEGFMQIYENLIYPQMNKLPEHSLDRERFGKLTYGELMEYREYVRKHDWDRQAEEEWERKYDLSRLTARANEMVDSIVAINGASKHAWDFLGKPEFVAYEFKEHVNKGDTVSAGFRMCRDEFIHKYIDRSYHEKSYYLFERPNQLQYEYNPLAYTILNTIEGTDIDLKGWGWSKFDR